MKLIKKIGEVRKHLYKKVVHGRVCSLTSSILNNSLRKPLNEVLLNMRGAFFHRVSIDLFSIILLEKILEQSH